MMIHALLCSALLYVRFSSATWPVPNEATTWLWQSSTVGGRWLYVDSGWYNIADDTGDNQGVPLTSTFAVDLSKSWSTTTIDAVVSAKPPSMQTRRAPELWYDAVNHRICEWGGWPVYADTTYPLWCATLDNDGGVSWSADPTPDIGSVTLLPTFASAWTYSANSLYSLGGLAATASSDYYVNTTIAGMVVQQFQDRSWHNISSAGASENGYNVFGSAIQAPHYGSDGIIVVLGGQDPSSQTYDYRNPDDSSFVAMSQVSIFETKSQAWYQQSATGSIPKPRGRFCMVGARAPDNVTHEIFVFGGGGLSSDVDNADDPDYLNVFVLSLPAFVWFEISAPASSRRTELTCQVIGNRQLFVMGGSVFTAEQQSDVANIPDPWKNKIGIFDMVELLWKFDYDADAAPYQRPKVVQDFYLTNTQTPSWSNPALAQMFPNASEVAGEIRSFTSASTPASTSVPISRPSMSGPGPSNNDKHEDHTGAIAGGTVSCVIVLVCLISLIFFMVRRRNRSNESRCTKNELDSHGVSSGVDGKAFEMEVPPAELAGSPLRHLANFEVHEVDTERRRHL